MPRSLHCRDEEQARGRATQLSSRHCCDMGQSASTLHSTQRPEAALHTWPGQVRDEVQAAPAAQRWATQVALLPGQSARVRHWTQAPRAESQTCPAAAHWRVEVQLSGAASGASAARGASGAASLAASLAASMGTVVASSGPTGGCRRGAQATSASEAQRAKRRDDCDGLKASSPGRMVIASIAAGAPARQPGRGRTPSANFRASGQRAAGI